MKTKGAAMPLFVTYHYDQKWRKKQNWQILDTFFGDPKTNNYFRFRGK